MIFDNDFLTKLSKQAVSNPRKRENFDLRNSEHDLSQRMLNAVEPETIMPIHRHSNTSTTVIILRGAIRQNFYDDNGNLEESIILDSKGEIRAIQIEKGRWHNLESLEKGSVLFEAKDGMWEPYSLLEDYNK